MATPVINPAAHLTRQEWCDLVDQCYTYMNENRNNIKKMTIELKKISNNINENGMKVDFDYINTALINELTEMQQNIINLESHLNSISNISYSVRRMEPKIHLWFPDYTMIYDKIKRKSGQSRFDQEASNFHSKSEKFKAMIDDPNTNKTDIRLFNRFAKTSKYADEIF